MNIIFVPNFEACLNICTHMILPSVYLSYFFLSCTCMIIFLFPDPLLSTIELKRQMSVLEIGKVSLLSNCGLPMHLNI